MKRAWAVVAVVGTCAVAAEAVVSATMRTPPLEAAAHAAVGAAWIGAGLAAWARQSEPRMGALMTSVGIAWFIARPGWSAPLPATVAYLLDSLALAVAIHAMLAFPSGYLQSRLHRTIVGVAYAVVLVGNPVGALFWDPRDSDPDAGANLVMVSDAPAVAGAVSATTTSIGMLLGVATVAALVRCWNSASAAGRAVLGPVILTGALAGAITVVHIALLRFGPDDALLRWSAWFTFGLVPLAFLAGLIRARLRRAAMTGLMVDLGRLPPAREVQDALARALGDPTLRLAYWDAEAQRYVDLDGEPSPVTTGAPDRAVTILEHEGRRFAAIDHDPYLYEDRELLEAVATSARLAVENSRLQSQLRSQLKEVRASRARIVEAADGERQRLERDLHDGAQQRLLGIRLALRLAQTRARSDDLQVHEILTEAETELMLALSELRALARGLHPAVLSEEGLVPALASLARRSPVPVELNAECDQRLPARLEAAAYFVASEALANVAKHADAASVTISLARTPGRVRLEIRDDGRGGADARRGSGLSGLRDRVEALDGELTILSPPHAGTTLSAELPCT